MSDLAKTLAENQKKMLKLIEPATEKLINLPETEDTDSETENVPPTVISTPMKTKTTTTKMRPVNSRNKIGQVIASTCKILQECLSETCVFYQPGSTPNYLDMLGVHNYQKLSFVWMYVKIRISWIFVSWISV